MKNLLKFDKKIYLSFSMIFFSIVLSLGILNWFLFFNYGETNFHFLDWKYVYGIYKVYEISIKELSVPYHASLFSTDIISTVNILESETSKIPKSRFISNLWNFFQPQVLIMGFTGVKIYLSLLLSFYFLISVYFFNKILNILKFSFFTKITLIILFCFNGKFFAMSGVGMTQMAIGYFFIPIFYYILILHFKNDDHKLKSNIKFALLYCIFFTIVLSQSDLHTLFEMGFVGMLLLILRPVKMITYLFGCLSTCLTSLWYVLPVYNYGEIKLNEITVGDDHWRRFGISGYGHENGSVGKPYFENINLESFNYFSNNLFDIILNIIKYKVNILYHIYESFIIPYGINDINQQVYNLHVSSLGFLIFIVGIIFFKKKDLKYFPKNFKYLILSSFLIYLFSIGPFYKYLIILLNNIYAFNPVSAIPSRLMIYFFFIILILSGLGIERVLKKMKLFYSKIIFIIPTIILFNLLWYSKKFWISNAYLEFNEKDSTELIDVKLIEVKDQNYENLVNISYLISLLFFALIIYLFKKNKSNIMST